MLIPRLHPNDIVSHFSANDRREQRAFSNFNLTKKHKGGGTTENYRSQAYNSYIENIMTDDRSNKKLFNSNKDQMCDISGILTI